MNQVRRSLVLLAAFLALAAPARAELVFFESGRTLSVKAHTVDGDSLVLTLRSGGQIICERSVIARIEPDEVPYPEPEPPPPAAQDVDVVGVMPPADLPTPYGDLIDRLSFEQNVS